VDGTVVLVLTYWRKCHGVFKNCLVFLYCVSVTPFYFKKYHENKDCAKKREKAMETFIECVLGATMDVSHAQDDKNIK
jgi:hypothetical protein